ncbi:hypothetical protein D3C86_1892520 [compost metagenome]
MVGACARVYVNVFSVRADFQCVPAVIERRFVRPVFNGIENDCHFRLVDAGRSHAGLHFVADHPAFVAFIVVDAHISCQKEGIAMKSSALQAGNAVIFDG